MKYSQDKHEELCCDEQNPSQQFKYRTDEEKKALITRLNRIEGQVRGIKGMIERDTYCNDILIQVAAVQSAMKGVSKLILENHMRTCLVDRIQSGDEGVIDEILKTIDRIIK